VVTGYRQYGLNAVAGTILLGPEAFPAHWISLNVQLGPIAMKWYTEAAESSSASGGDDVHLACLSLPTLPSGNRPTAFVAN
jgi:hypothetical protein